MKQKQRGSDKQRTKVKVTLKAKEIEIKGRKIELEPLIERMNSGFERMPQDVSEAMGIALTAPEIELLLFDKKGFKEYISELSGEEYKEHYIGFYFPGEKTIPIDVESGALARSHTLKNDELLDGLVAMAIAKSSWHEVAHMAHDLYDDKAMEKRLTIFEEFWTGRKKIDVERMLEIGNKEWKDMRSKDIFEYYKGFAKYSINYRHALGYRKELGLVEGIARWTEREVIRKNLGKKAAEATYGIPKSIKLSKKIKLSLDDEYAFGYRFFEKISQMTDANVIRLAIDHNPTYVEMLYPQLYILRMKAALLI